MTHLAAKKKKIWQNFLEFRGSLFAPNRRLIEFSHLRTVKYSKSRWLLRNFTSEFWFENFEQLLDYQRWSFIKCRFYRYRATLQYCIIRFQLVKKKKNYIYKLTWIFFFFIFVLQITTVARSLMTKWNNK